MITLMYDFQFLPMGTAVKLHSLSDIHQRNKLHGRTNCRQCFFDETQYKANTEVTPELASGYFNSKPWLDTRFSRKTPILRLV